MNTGLSDREHAQKARQLIEACGGLEEACRACAGEDGKPYHKPSMSNYQTVTSGCSMPMKVVDTLELYCGKPIYSAALFERFDSALPTGTLVDQACDLSEQAVSLQGLIRRAIADERLTPRELDNLARAESATGEALDKLRAARRDAETQRPLPRAV